METNKDIIKKTKDWCKEWNYYLDEEYLEEEGYKLPFGVSNNREVIPLEILEKKLNEVRPQCQIRKTKYCLCDCGKHKENGDY